MRKVYLKRAQELELPADMSFELVRHLYEISDCGEY